MAAYKTGTIVVYSILAWMAISFPLSVLSQFAMGSLVWFAVWHGVDCFKYRKLIARAPGRPAWHYANVFLFGVFHQITMKQAIRAAGGRPYRDV